MPTWERMDKLGPAEGVTRPTVCPFCNGRIIDTLAKVLSVTTVWRCRGCDRTWTIASLPAQR